MTASNPPANAGPEVGAIWPIENIQPFDALVEDPKLTTSMARVGMLIPVIVNGNKQLLDGHRRLASAKRLGWSTIWVVTDPEAL